MATSSGNGIEHGVAEDVVLLRSMQREANGRQEAATGADSGHKHLNTEPAGAATAETDQPLTLAPLVDQVAYGFAKVLVVAMKELEIHIADETRRVGDTVGRRLDSLQASFQNLSELVSEQRSIGLAVQAKSDELAAATASLQESEARQDAELSTLRSQANEFSTLLSARIEAVGKSLSDSEARQDAAVADLRSTAGEVAKAISEKIEVAVAFLSETDNRQQADVASLRSETRELGTTLSARVDSLVKDLEIQQEDITAIKSTLSTFSTRMDSAVDRLDRQAEALHSMYTTHSQRESELEQLIEGLTRLRTLPAPASAGRL